MEQRQEVRFDYNVRFFVHIHSAKEDPDMVGMALECEAVDYSAHGMQFSTRTDLSPGTELNITIGVGEPFAMYLLRGEVRWVRERDDTYYMGVLLRSHGDTDLDRWLEYFESISVEPPD